MHVEGSQFSKAFLDSLSLPEVVTLTKSNFVFLGWNVGDSKYHSALKKALNSNHLEPLCALVENKICSANILLPTDDSLTIFACMQKVFELDTFLMCLGGAQECFSADIGTDVHLPDSIMFVLDLELEACFQFVENCNRIRPKTVNFETDRLKDVIKKAFGVPLTSRKLLLLYLNNTHDRFSEVFWENVKDENVIRSIEESFLLLGWDVEDSKYHNALNQALNDNELGILAPLVDKKICSAIIIVPVGGNYTTLACMRSSTKSSEFSDYIRNAQEHLRNEVEKESSLQTIEEERSGQTDLDSEQFHTGLLLVAALPTVAIAPAAILAAGLAGLGAGLYAVGRSSYALYDRSRHKESMSILESEPRGAYLNIVAGALGFVGVGANVLVQQLVARGVNIAEAGIWTVNGIQIANIGASGAGLVNSGYEIVDQYFNNNQTPSALTMVQLGTSIVFFGNAVFSFKTCGTLIEETQQQTLKNFKDSLRSNRHRKTFNKLVKSTINSKDGNQKAGMAEVISTIRKIPNKDEVFAVLTRANKQMNDKNIKFSAKDGQITLNDVPVNMSDFAAMSKGQREVFLSDLPLHGETPSQAVDTVTSSFSANGITCNMDVIRYIVKITSALSGNVTKYIIDIMSELLCKIAVSLNEELDKLFPNKCKYAQLVDMLMRFISKKADEWEMVYQEWKETKNPELYSEWFDHVDVVETRRWLRFFENCAKICLNPSELRFKSLLEYFHTWLAQKICERQQKIEQDNEIRAHSANWKPKKVECCTCGGYYYSCAY
nr:unnamed protein product [Callosobruchus chinensis]